MVEIVPVSIIFWFFSLLSWNLRYFFERSQALHYVFIFSGSKHFLLNFFLLVVSYTVFLFCRKFRCIPCHPLLLLFIYYDFLPGIQGSTLFHLSLLYNFDLFLFILLSMHFILFIREKSRLI